MGWLTYGLATAIMPKGLDKGLLDEDGVVLSPIPDTGAAALAPDLHHGCE